MLPHFATRQQANPDLSNGYVIITPARNEEYYIEKTIQSVIIQTVLPVRWIIISDGSTDRTDEIVQKYVIDYPWVELIRMSEHSDRQFAAKVNAFNAGYQRVSHINFDVVCNLDADVSFEKDYFEFLLAELSSDLKLGVVGTPFVEGGSPIYDYRFTNIEDVAGACQMYRRQCFEDIGGYIALKDGGEDTIAIIKARMKGWKTRTVIEKMYVHHRALGTAQTTALMSRFKYGQKDYFLGGHPLWQFFRILYQMIKKPYVIGGLLMFFGYTWALIKRVKRPISPELMEFYRREQMQRLRQLLWKIT